MEPMNAAEVEGAFLVMTLGFIACIVLFIIASLRSNDERIDKIATTFNLIIVIYVALSLHMLYPTQWKKYVMQILLGYIAGKLIMKNYV